MPDGFIVTAIKSFVLVNLVMVMFAFMTWLERRLIGRFQAAPAARTASGRSACCSRSPTWAS